MKKFNNLKFFNEIYYNNNFCDYIKNKWEISSKLYKKKMVIMKKFYINYMKN